jgi:hypothetical protein
MGTSEEILTQNVKNDISVSQVLSSEDVQQFQHDQLEFQ